MSLYTVTKIKNLSSNMEMNERKLRGRAASIYTPSDLVIRAIESKKEITDI